MIAVKGVFRVALIIALAFMVWSCATEQRVHAVSETGRSDVTLMPGVTESTVYVTDSGLKNIRAHILRIQNGANVSLKAGYKGYYTSGSTASSRGASAGTFKDRWKWDEVSVHVNEYESSKDKAGSVIAATSGDFLGANGAPYGTLVMEGRELANSPRPYFAVLKNGTYAIKPAGSSSSDVLEGIGGDEMLVQNGQIAVKKSTIHDPTIREPRQAIGITANNDVVMINIDGREPSSSGATLYTLAEIFKAQGCVDAINMDGGGSATFMTKRSGDSSVKVRNTLGDGIARNIASSILVVKNNASSSKKITGSATVSMKNSSTALTKSSSGVYSYKINGRAQTGLFMVNGKNYLFDKKGNGLTKTIKLGSNKYTFKKGEFTKSNDKKAGEVRMGRCGAGSGNSNLLFALHYGDKKLNVGLNPLVKKNGKMKNWSGSATTLPWYSMKDEIKTVAIGSGVTTVGDRFLYSSRQRTIFDGSIRPTMSLSKLTFPSTLTSIGAKSFPESVKLKAVTIPAKVKKIKTAAFIRTGAKKVTFKTSKPPSLGKQVFTGTKIKKIYVKKTAKWKKFVKAKKFKKVGYKKSVKLK